MGGLYLLPAQEDTGESVRVETAFAGFKEPLVHLFLAGFLTQVLTATGHPLPDLARHLSLRGLVSSPCRW